MALKQTQLKGRDVGDGSIGRADLNVSLAGEAVIRKMIDVASSGVKISSYTGVDPGTGDVGMILDWTLLDTRWGTSAWAKNTLKPTYTTSEIPEAATPVNLYYTDTRVNANARVVTAYNYAGVGHLPLAGGSLTGPLGGTTATFSTSITAPTFGTNGGRPVVIANGDVSMKADAGGWAMSYNFKGSANAALGGWGAFGATDALSYYYIGTYGQSNTKIYPNGDISAWGNITSAQINTGAKQVTDWNSGDGLETFRSSESGATNSAIADFTYGIRLKFHRNQDQYHTDLVASLYYDKLFFRRKSDNVYKDWRELWHSGNFNPSSYLLLSGGMLNKPAALVDGAPLGINDRLILYPSNFGTANNWYVNMNVSGSGFTIGKEYDGHIAGNMAMPLNFIGWTGTTFSTTLTAKALYIGQQTNGTSVINAHDSFAYFGCNTDTNGMKIGPGGEATFINSITATTGNFKVPINTDYKTSGTNAGAGIAILSQNGMYGLFGGVAPSGFAWLQVGRNDGDSTLYDLKIQSSGGSAIFGGGVSVASTFTLAGTFNSTTTNSSFFASDLNIGYTTYQGYKLAVNGVIFAANGGNSDQWYAGFDLASKQWKQSSRDFVDGTLITTTINYAVSSGDAFLLEIKGNSYGYGVPFNLTAQGYIYADTIINVAGISNGTQLAGIIAFNLNGALCFWFPRMGYWQGFDVYCSTVTGPGNKTNTIASISNSVKPSGRTKEVNIAASVSQGWNSSNFTPSSYLPINSNNNIIIGDTILFGNGSSVATTAARGIFFHTNSDTNYGVFKPAGTWTQALNIAFYTGVHIAADVGYGGTKIYNSPSMATELMSVGNGDNHVRIAYNLLVGGSGTFSGGGFNSRREIKNIHKDWGGNALNVICKFKIRDFNYKTRPDYDRTLGFIIDEIPKEIGDYALSGEERNAVNTYSLHGLSFKGLQEVKIELSKHDTELMRQAKEIITLKAQILLLEGRLN